MVLMSHGFTVAAPGKPAVFHITYRKNAMALPTGLKPFQPATCHAGLKAGSSLNACFEMGSSISTEMDYE
jgi:hypothetical protein